jgi:hypothetical protein
MPIPEPVSKQGGTTLFEKSVSIAILMVVQAVSLAPFRLTDEFGERDSYRMLLGLVDTLTNGTPFDSSLLYNRQASFGYYGLWYLLAPLLPNTPQALTAAMNWLAFVSVVLFVIPEYLIVERLFGRHVAIASVLTLAATPVWWNYGLFAHPITTALLLFFTGLAILCRYDQVPPLGVRLGITGLLTAALTFRFDCILLFIPLFAILWACRKLRLIGLLKEFSLYLLGSLTLFMLAQHSLPAVTQGTEPKSILSLLVLYQNLSLFIPGIRSSIIDLVIGFTGVLLLMVPISAWILYRRRNYPALLFVSGFIVVNLIFWVPNPGTGARHYLMTAPAMSISAALVVVTFFSWLLPRMRLPYPAWAAGIVTAIGIVGASEAQQHNSKGYYFRSPFEQTFQIDRQKIDEAKRIALELVHLPQIGTPAVVFSDSNLVIAEMERLTGNVSATLTVVKAGSKTVGVHVVRLNKNQFVMVEQGWDQNMIRAFDESGAYPGLPLVETLYSKDMQYGNRPRLTVVTEGG